MLKFFDVSNGYFDKKEWNDNGNGNFAKVYFRINTIGFNSMNGSFENETDRNAFRSEIAEIIKSFGIADYSIRQENNEHLYAHPNDISGIVEKSKIKAIAEAINNSKTMTIRWVDIYEEYAIISDDDYMEILNSKREEMAKYIVEKCFTKRTSQFFLVRDIAKGVQEKFKENRINAIEDINNFGMTHKYATDIIKQLVNDGYLIGVEQNGYEYIRSLNKTEQKKNKVNYDSMRIGA